MKYISHVSLTSFLFLVLAACSKPEPSAALIVPQPNEISIKSGVFEIQAGDKISISDASLKAEAELLKSWIAGRVVLSEGKSAVHLSINPDIAHAEGYRLEITEDALEVQGKTPAGVFYGLQTLRQLLPVSIENGEFSGAVLSQVSISDQPRFGWRGMHLDVSRHFMPLDFIKKYIDYIAMHKMNVFHWHLVDGIGWRIEIKKYPRLTDWGAWRVVKSEKPWVDYEVWKPEDERPKEGGYYTQDEIREIVAYATERHVTVVPEIELPGHSEVVFQCYPELQCVSEEDSVENIGVYCAGNSDSYTFLEDIIDEFLELFPSEYIHIGGDEVNKQNWKSCPKCQKAIKNNRLADVYELQSHFVNHFDRYLTEGNRKLIGWHEILEGELTPSATIMYWGGADGVKENLEYGHETVLSPGTHFYFDHYQGLSDNEPAAWGGFSNLTKVYNYEPSPENLEEDSNLILGVQGNVWTEYMKTPAHVEYMTIPRMSALSEVSWSKKSDKDWDSFRLRLEPLLARFEEMGVNVSSSAYTPAINVTLDTSTNLPYLSFQTEMPSDVYYTLDGTDATISSTKYNSEPLMLEETVTVKAIAVLNGKIKSPVEETTAIIHDAKGAKVEMVSQPYKRYTSDGGSTLVDLKFGGNKWGNGKWLGVIDEDFEIIIELEDAKQIQKVGFSCIEDTGSGIYLPGEIEVLGSNDGSSFTSIGFWSREVPKERARPSDVKNQIIEIQGNKKSYRHLKIKAKSVATINNRNGVFTFVDEIVVN